MNFIATLQRRNTETGSRPTRKGTFASLFVRDILKFDEEYKGMNIDLIDLNAYISHSLL